MISNLQETRGLSTLCWADVGSGWQQRWRTQHGSHRSSPFPAAHRKERGFSAPEQEHAAMPDLLPTQKVLITDELLDTAIYMILKNTQFVFKYFVFKAPFAAEAM